MTIWKEQAGGTVSPYYDASEELGEGALVYATQPDWIRYPDELPHAALAGKKGLVTGVAVYRGPCPNCGAEGPKKALITQHGLRVICCKDCELYCFCEKGAGSR
jgi:hypothetical protein